jgi:hypothetical protein
MAEETRTFPRELVHFPDSHFGGGTKSSFPIPGVNMSKEKSAKKETKKAPAKSMKEKKLEKREKKAGKK